MTPAVVVDALAARHGRTFCSEAGIRIDRGTPAPLFRLLCLAVLISARIPAEIAMAASRALADEGWTTAGKLADSTWERRTRVLNEAGYARYDESTSRYLGHDADLLLDRFGGDLRLLRDEADGDPAVLHGGLTEFKGIGDVGADFFRREVQGIWAEFGPFLDDRAAAGAAELGLPDQAVHLRRLVDDDGAFTRLVAALVRTDLAGDHQAVLADAGDR